MRASDPGCFAGRQHWRRRCSSRTNSSGSWAADATAAGHSCQRRQHPAAAAAAGWRQEWCAQTSSLSQVTDYLRACDISARKRYAAAQLRRLPWLPLSRLLPPGCVNQRRPASSSLQAHVASHSPAEQCRHLAVPPPPPPPFSSAVPPPRPWSLSLPCPALPQPGARCRCMTSASW